MAFRGAKNLTKEPGLQVLGSCLGPTCAILEGNLMKRFTVLLPVFVLAFNLVGFAQRLPNLAQPENYRLNFAPNFDKDNFAGDEAIQVRILKPTSSIVLNSLEIEIQQASVTTGNASQI